MVFDTDSMISLAAVFIFWMFFYGGRMIVYILLALAYGTMNRKLNGKAIAKWKNKNKKYKHTHTHIPFHNTLTRYIKPPQGHRVKCYQTKMDIKSQIDTAIGLQIKF